MQVTKNIWKGGEIKDLNEIVRLAKEKKSLVILQGQWHHVKPAAFIQNWMLRDILKAKLFYAIHNDEIPEVDFEETKI